jgi:hypothetical protein
MPSDLKLTSKAGEACDMPGAPSMGLLKDPAKEAGSLMSPPAENPSTRAGSPHDVLEGMACLKLGADQVLVPSCHPPHFSSVNPLLAVFGLFPGWFGVGPGLFWFVGLCLSLFIIWGFSPSSLTHLCLELRKIIS